MDKLHNNNSIIKRYLKTHLEEHLNKYRQMIFLTGPRQVGKTTLAKSLIDDPIPEINYFNWDLINHRKLLTTKIFKGDIDLIGPNRKVIVFDEIHKYSRWKNSLKGLFDLYEPNTHWIITGSAGFNIFKKGQDSLVGRSFTYHLAPLSVAELSYEDTKNSSLDLENICKYIFKKPNENMIKTFNLLLQFSGFPEPFLKQDKSFLKKWSSSRLDRLINQDLASTEFLKNLQLVENLVFLLPGKVGSPLSINSLREDLELHFSTVKHWLELLERIFYGFSVRPFSIKSSRMIKKEYKWYLWDWTEIEDDGIRFENMAAVHLLKYVNFINDTGMDNISLHYIRDKEKREVDFLLCRKGKPKILIECKSSFKEVSKSLVYYAKKLKVERSIQLTLDSIYPQIYNSNDISIDVISAASFLSILV